MSKIIFSDIDGTLINDELQVTPKTRDALRRQIIQGNLFVPVSARMPKAIMTAAEQVTKVCPMIAYNGALVLDEMGRPLVSKFMSSKVAGEICHVVEKQSKSVVWNAYSGYVWYAQNDGELVQHEEAIVQVKATILPVERIASLQGVHKLLLMGEAAELDGLQALLKSKYPDLYLVKSAPHLLEIMQQGVSKSSGVKEVAKEFNVSLADCYAFGDNYNDEDMLEAVGHPYLMGNAPADLKSKFTVTADHNHDGIAAFLDGME